MNTTPGSPVALELRERIPGDHEETLLILKNLGALYWNQKRYKIGIVQQHTFPLPVLVFLSGGFVPTECQPGMGPQRPHSGTAFCFT